MQLVFLGIAELDDQTWCVHTSLLDRLCEWKGLGYSFFLLTSFKLNLQLLLGEGVKFSPHIVGSAPFVIDLMSWYTVLLGQVLKKEKKKKRGMV